MTEMNALRIIEWVLLAALLVFSLSGCGRVKEEPAASEPSILDAEIQSLEGVPVETAKQEAARCAELVGAKHNIPYHNSTSNRSDMFDRDLAEQFDAPNRLIVYPGEALELK